MFLLLSACTPEDPKTDDSASPCAESTWYADEDGDSFGDPDGATLVACEPAGGFVLDGTDCDDGRADVHPGADEACDGVDANCDGRAEAALGTWYTDADGDGYGEDTSGVETCEPPEGATATGGDCDDTDPAVHPGADEACDGDDDDCDGVADLGEVAVWHADADADGYGSAYDRVESCTSPGETYTQTGGDCQPDDPAVNPGAAELCNDTDDNCDGEIDEGFERDGDGYRSTACADGEDCDDADPAVNPAAEDTCGDGVDDDCTGTDRMCGFDATIDLATGEVLYGDQYDDVGRQLRVADLDADGVDDLFVATMYRDGRDGGAWVYTAGALTSGNLSDLAWRIDSTVEGGGAGRSIGTGDVDGDGVLDVSFGLPYADASRMGVLLGPVDADRSLADAMWFVGEEETFCGHGTDLGDLDGDGFEDGVIGAETSNGGLGGVFISYGPLTGDVDLLTAADAEILGAGGNTSRWLLADGDYDGDGVSDLLISAAYGSFLVPSGGGAFLVYGPPADGLDLATDYDGRFAGSKPGEYAGDGIGEGDLDGDGLDDVLVGSYYDGAASGAAYTFYGPAAGDIPTASADIVVIGVADSWLGSDLIARDLDGDGSDELVVGGAGEAGGAWIFQGLSAGAWDTTDALSVLPTISAPSRTGTGVEVGDLDGDGWMEVMIGAPAEVTNGAMAGAVYVVEAEE